ncbi:MAG TPA: DUF892 family protein [Segetibacter sp.]|jgi:ferritin-like metal-binding protein YciE
MQEISDLNSLLVSHIKNLYAAEQQIKQAIPAIIESVQHSSLKNALTHHSNLTDDQLLRLEKMLTILQKKTAGMKDEDFLLNKEYVSKGMAGLIEEANEMLSYQLSSEVIDAAVIASVQKLEHYEICCYGSALAFAVQLKLHDVELLLKETLEEEYDADDLLTALATSALNKEAAHGENISSVTTAEEKGEGRTEATNLEHKARVSISERTINSPGGRSGTSHRGYGSGESRGH